MTSVYLKKRQKTNYKNKNKKMKYIIFTLTIILIANSIIIAHALNETEKHQAIITETNKHGRIREEQIYDNRKIHITTTNNETITIEIKDKTIKEIRYTTSNNYQKTETIITKKPLQTHTRQRPNNKNQTIAIHHENNSIDTIHIQQSNPLLIQNITTNPICQ